MGGGHSVGLVDCLPEIKRGVALILSLIESLAYPMNQEFSDLTIRHSSTLWTGSKV